MNTQWHPTNLLPVGMLADPTFLHTPLDIILFNSSLIPSCHFSLAFKSGCSMVVEMFVAQLDHSFHWLQMQSH